MLVPCRLIGQDRDGSRTLQSLKILQRQWHLVSVDCPIWNPSIVPATRLDINASAVTETRNQVGNILGLQNNRVRVLIHDTGDRDVVI